MGYFSPQQLIKAGLEEGIEEMHKVEGKVAGYWRMLGPGLTTGASDDDPSGIATYSQTGAQYGFTFIWLSLFTFPLMAVIQEMCARIGIVTGQGLAANIRQHYSKKVLYFCTALLLVANIFNIGADFGAMVKGVQLLFPYLSFGLLIAFFGTVGLVLQIFTTYAGYARYLKFLALLLFTYVITAFFVDIDWMVVWKATLVPHMSFTKDQIILVCGILGTTISPYLFFWQTSQEVEEKMLKDQRNEAVVAAAPSGIVSINTPLEKERGIRDMRVDVWSGMFISNLVMFFIIATCAGALFSHGVTNIATAADAAEALRPLAGDFAFLLFAVGIIGTGMLAIPVLAGSAAYAVSESMGWRFGLYRKLKEAYAFYGVIIVATLVGIGLNFIGLDPIKALIYSAVLNGIVSPVILYLIVRIAGRKEVMGENVNGRTSSCVGWLTVVLMTLAAAGALWSLLS